MKCVVLGKDRLAKKLEKVSGYLQAPELREAFVRAGLLVERRAKVNATPSVRTGRLRASITHRVKRERDNIYTSVGSRVKYAPYVELGTRRMKAKPYLLPALKESDREVLQLVKNAINKILGK